MTHTVFYSWQADTPPKVGRTFIEKSLGKAIEQLAADVSVDVAIREGLAVDKDTKGVAGTPPIVDTIFRKIDSAAAFLADLTFVGTRLDGRPMPNPNVLVEYGWALKSRSYGRIICVVNIAYGEPAESTMPFNMSHLRWPIQYNLPDSADAAVVSQARAKLAGQLKAALRDILESTEFKFQYKPIGRHGPNVLAAATQDVNVGQRLSFQSNIPEGQTLRVVLHGTSRKSPDDSCAAWRFNVMGVTNWVPSTYQESTSPPVQYFNAEAGPAEMQFYFGRTGDVQIEVFEGDGPTPSWSKRIRVLNERTQHS